MLLRHSFYYVLARGIPGLVNFAALALYTRLMAPDEFGRYSLVIAAIGLLDVMVFQWLRLVLARFIPKYQDKPQFVQESVLALYFFLAAVLLFVGACAALMWRDPVIRGLFIVGIPLTLAQSWFQMDLMLSSAQLQPRRYGHLMWSKALLALAGGASLVWLGFGAQGPLLGLLFGIVVAWLTFGQAAWRAVRPRWPSRTLLHEYVSYGLPLVVTFALGWVIASSDRIIIAWLLDPASAGVYAVGYDLPQQTLGLVLTIINTAAHPLVTRLLESEGLQAARIQMRRNGELIFAFSLSGGVALIALGPQLVAVFIGASFREGALTVLPWVAASAVVAGLKAFHFDIAFHLMHKSRWLVLTSGIAALANVVLNFLLIPSHGIVGAAWATLGSFGLACVASAFLGSRVFPMPDVFPIFIKGVLPAASMYAGIAAVLMLDVGALVAILLGGSVGGVLSIGAAFLLDLGGLRQSVLSRMIVVK